MCSPEHCRAGVLRVRLVVQRPALPSAKDGHKASSSPVSDRADQEVSDVQGLEFYPAAGLTLPSTQRGALFCPGFT